MIGQKSRIVWSKVFKFCYIHCEQKSRRYPDFRLNLRTVGLELRWYIHPNQTLEVWFILVLIYELLALRGWVFAKIKLHQLWDTKSWYLATNISISYTRCWLFWYYNKIFQLRLVNWVIKFKFYDVVLEKAKNDKKWIFYD